MKVRRLHVNRDHNIRTINTRKSFEKRFFIINRNTKRTRDFSDTISHVLKPLSYIFSNIARGSYDGIYSHGSDPLFRHSELTTKLQWSVHSCSDSFSVAKCN